eukprot:766480-Hanusia_phi.AAC.22
MFPSYKLFWSCSTRQALSRSVSYRRGRAGWKGAVRGAGIGESGGKERVKECDTWLPPAPQTKHPHDRDRRASKRGRVLCLSWLDAGARIQLPVSSDLDTSSQALEEADALITEEVNLQTLSCLERPLLDLVRGGRSQGEHGDMLMVVVVVVVV